MKETDVTENKQISNDIELMEITTLLWNKRKVITIVTSVFTILGIIYAFFIATPMFKSTITLYPASQDQDLNSSLKLMVSQFGFGGITTSNNYNIPDVVKSRRIKKKILEQKWQTEKFSDKNVDLIEFWQIDDNDSGMRIEIAMEKLDDLLSVSTNDETGLISIGITTEESQLSADIVNFIGNEVQSYIRKEQKNQGKENRIFIEQRLSETKKELMLAEEILKKFKEKNRNVNNSAEIQLEEARLQRSITIKQEVYITLAKQKEIAMIEEVKNKPIVNILDIGEKAMRKSEPKRLAILIITFVIALFFSITAVILQNKFKTNAIIKK